LRNLGQVPGRRVNQCIASGRGRDQHYAFPQAACGNCGTETDEYALQTGARHDGAPQA
jgi:hypothetical protein